MMLHNGTFGDEQAGAQVMAATEAVARVCFEHGARRVIIDATNLNPAVMRRWYELARELRVPLVIPTEFADVPLETCLACNARRGPVDRVPDRRMYEMDRMLREQTLPLLALIRDGVIPWESIEKRG
jgi:predicted kinase